jgi:uncharacterized protein involved in exopolysaccharide biosynthesis
MTSLLDSLNRPVVQCIGWALLHFLWQGLLLGAVWAALKHILRRHDPNIRYAAACLVLLLMMAAPMVTCSVLLHRPPVAAGPKPPDNSSRVPWFSVDTPSGSPASSTSGPGLDRVAAALEPALPWLVALWAMGVGLLSGKLIRGGWSVHRLTLARTTPVTSEWLERLQTLRHRMRVSRPVRLLQSALVEVPTVAGWFRPVILLPISTLAGLSVAQLELILAHELAHIRRGDAWVNLLQILVETVLFYHPAVWWVSRCIREERELCCDDLAVRVSGDRLAYAQALTLLETLRSPALTGALAATGGSLLQRIRHVLGLPDTPLASSWRRRTGAGLVGFGAVLFVVGIAWLASSPKQYEAVARIVISRDEGAPVVLGESGGKVPDPYYAQTEAERLQSGLVLAKVAEKLDLARRWGKPGAATPLAPDETGARLRKCIEARVVENTYLIEIHARSSANHKPAEEAAEIANAVAAVYKEVRLDPGKQLAQQGIQALQKKLDEQNEEVRKAMDQADRLRREHQITDFAEDFGEGSLLESETVRRLEGERISRLANHDALSKLLEQLKEVRATQGESKTGVAILNAIPDQELALLLQDLWRAEASFAKTSSLYSEKHPEVESLAAVMKDLDAKVHAKTEGIIIGLESRLAASSAQVETLRKEVDKAKQDDLLKTEQARPYFVAKRDLDSKMKIRDAILLRVLQETVDANIPKSSMVEIVDPATPPTDGRYPGHRTGLSLCGLGVLCSLLGMILRLAAPLHPAIS